MQFQYDDSSKFSYRTMHIHATDKQLSKLERMSDPNDIDEYIAEILSQTNFGTIQLVKEATYDVASAIYNAMPHIEIPAKTIEIATNFAFLVAGYVVCRQFGVNFAIVLIFAAIYFLYQYLDYECRKVSCKSFVHNWAAHNL